DGGRGGLRWRGDLRRRRHLRDAIEQLLEQARYLVATWGHWRAGRLVHRLAAGDRARQLVDLALELALAVGDRSAQTGDGLIDRRGHVGGAQNRRVGCARLGWGIARRCACRVALARACTTAASAAATAGQ